MAARAGAQNPRVAAARELLAAKGRRERQCFAFEGPTLLREALASGIEIRELFVTEERFEENADVRALDARGIAVHLVDERTIAKISDVETPTGIVAVAPTRLAPLERIVEAPLALVLADLNDPGNAGTLLRSAEAFGASGVVFGRAGVDPYHPKVVRAAMGAVFRLPLAVCEPAALAAAAASAGTEMLGLAMDGEDLRGLVPAARRALVVGHERRGLGPWEALCARRVSIPMAGATESLNAAVAGSIALYEAFRSSQAP